MQQRLRYHGNRWSESTDCRTYAKINKLDLNVNDLKEQASKIYDKLSDMDIDTQGIFEKIKTALSSIFAALSGLFN